MEAAHLSIQLSPDVQERLSRLARLTGQSENACARELIEENIDELENRYIAEQRLFDSEHPLTGKQVRKELGLEH